MKMRFGRIIALVLAATLILSVTAFAAEDVPVFEKKGGGAAGETINVTFNADFTKLNVEYTSSAIHEAGGGYSGFYMVWMVTGTTVGDKTYYIPKDGTLQYIGQGSASGNTFTFNGVYPTSMTDAAIMISGAGLKEIDTKDDAVDGLYTLGYVKMPYKLGDVDLDGDITSADAVAMNQHLAEIEELTGTSFRMADIDKDGSITSADAVFLNQYLAGSIKNFD